MRYVGYSRGFHDAGLAIIEEDGTVSYASNSERYSKIKYDPQLTPELESMIKKDDYVVFYQDLELNSEKYDYSPNPTLAMHGIGEVFTFDPKDEIGKSLRYTRDNREYSFEEVYFNSLEDATLPFHMHHESHVAQGLYTRPWQSKDDTVMVSIDGVGEEQSAVIYDSNYNVKFQHCAPQSIGWLYGATTTLLGYKRLEEEYIVMGMSAYGKPNDELVKLIKEYYNTFDNYTQEEQRIMRTTFVDRKVKFSTKEETRFKQHMNLPGTANMTYDFVKGFFDDYKKLMSKISAEDVAASIQKFTEDKIYEIMVHARQYGSKLVYSGGVAQNIVANSKIRDLFDEVHIAIAPSDAGSALGCAAKSWSEQTGGTHLKWSPYLGYNIEKDINPKEVVDYLMKNKVCGVANGRAEFGPRALGNRSLLGDVRYDIKDTVNKIKQRELFRPFAPAILEEYADEYFDGHKNEYMQYTCNAKHDYKSVIHVDGTSRCQVVKKDCQSVIRPILEEYFERTGIPMLLNTSLNIKGQPILNDEQDVEEWEKKYKVRIF